MNQKGELDVVGDYVRNDVFKMIGDMIRMNRTTIQYIFCVLIIIQCISCSENRSESAEIALRKMIDDRENFEDLISISNQLECNVSIDKKDSDYEWSILGDSTCDGYFVTPKVMSDINNILKEIDIHSYDYYPEYKQAYVSTPSLSLNYNPQDSLFSGFNGWLSIAQLEADFYDKSKDEWAYEIADGWYILKLKHSFH